MVALRYINHTENLLMADGYGLSGEPAMIVRFNPLGLMNIEEAKQVVRHARSRHARGLVVGVDQLVEASLTLMESNTQYYLIRSVYEDTVIRSNRKPSHDEVRHRLGLAGIVEVHEWNGGPRLWKLP